MSDPALFDPIGPDGPAVTAMGAQLTAWRAAGRDITPLVARTLLDQAYAVDLARLARRHTAITGANRVILELVTGFGLNEPAAPAAADPFDEFLRRVADDAHGHQAEQPGAPLGDAP